MPILFSLVARGTAILAKYASCNGNFIEVTEVVLSKIPPENAKLTYAHGNFLIHYIAENRINYLCITDDDFERSKAFSFLHEIQHKFTVQYGNRGLTALPYSMNSEFSRVMMNLMNHYSNSTSVLQRTQSQVEELRDIMVRNIDTMANRGEKLELLVQQADDLQANSVTFQSVSHRVRRTFWWRNIKLIIFIVVVVIVVLYFIVSIACGGLDWPCTRNS